MPDSAQASQAPSRPPQKRLTASLRRASIITATIPLFAERGFGSTTTAAAAAAANVNEALIFRYFQSKHGLFLACVDECWAIVQRECEQRMNELPEAERWKGFGGGFLSLIRDQPAIARMWVRFLVETTGVPETDLHLEMIMGQVHEFASRAIEQSQQAGGIGADRDPGTEAWILISLGLLGSVGSRLPQLAGEPFEHVVAAHRLWLTATAGQ